MIREQNYELLCCVDVAIFDIVDYGVPSGDNLWCHFRYWLMILKWIRTAEINTAQKIPLRCSVFLYFMCNLCFLLTYLWLSAIQHWRASGGNVFRQEGGGGMRGHPFMEETLSSRKTGQKDMCVMVVLVFVCGHGCLPLPCIIVLPVFIQSSSWIPSTLELVRGSRGGRRVGAETSRRAALLCCHLEKAGLHPFYGPVMENPVNEEVT